MKEPLVSVICLCHNQAPYLEEALQSVLNQEYTSVELIIVDDGSTDGSKELVRTFLTKHPVEFIDIPEAVGNCQAFNLGFKISKGDFIIDLAADDVLLPERIRQGLIRLTETNAGVHYSNAELIDVDGHHLSFHNDRFDFPMPEGDVYAHLAREYLVCPPTMMIRREVLESLGGYDESLSYEDFDFWVRSAREFAYCYSDEVLVKKRILPNSHSATHVRFRSGHQKSTLMVCEKILKMNRTVEEGQALKKRCWHEIRQCIKKGNLSLIPNYLSILKQC